MSPRAPSAPPPATPDEIEQRFYEALQQADIEQLMSVWSDDDDVSCVHPGGPRLLGAESIRAAFESIFANGAVDVRPQHVRRLHGPGCAVHSVVEHIRVATPEGLREAWVIATNVYVAGAEGWRLVAHHASPGSVVEQREPRENAAVLH